MLIITQVPENLLLLITEDIKVGRSNDNYKDKIVKNYCLEILTQM